tara:strand:+ start:315 stop:632 length:318 start_codon:yes stop_codon:yes gene_type:complete
MNRNKQNSGPKTTIYTKKPKSRSTANKVWNAVHSVYGQPPSWMRMIPARRWFENREGQKEFTNTSRWEISFDDEGKRLLVLSGPAKTVVEMLPTHFQTLIMQEAF